MSLSLSPRQPSCLEHAPLICDWSRFFGQRCALLRGFPSALQHVIEAAEASLVCWRGCTAPSRVNGQFWPCKTLSNNSGALARLRIFQCTSSRSVFALVWTKCFSLFAFQHVQYRNLLVRRGLICETLVSWQGLSRKTGESLLFQKNFPHMSETKSFQVSRREWLCREQQLEMSGSMFSGKVALCAGLSCHNQRAIYPLRHSSKMR